MPKVAYNHLIPLSSAIDLLIIFLMKILLNFPLFISSFILGCSPKVTVSPMERYHLADVVMRTDRDPLSQKMNEHAYFSREGSRGGRGVGGGGCGCN